MTNEAKVGAFTVAGTVILGGALVGLSGAELFHGGTYHIEVDLSKAAGLNPSSEVRYAGVKVGRIARIEPIQTGARVTAEIDEDIKVPADSYITIDASGFLGEKYLSIEPGKDHSRYLSDGDRVEGGDEASMDQMLGSMNTLVEEARDMLGSLSSVVNDPEVKKALMETSLNVRDLTANMSEMTATFSRIAGRGEGDIGRMMQNMNVMSENLVHVTKDVEMLVENFSDDGRTGENLREALKNLSSASARVDNMAKSLEGVVTDQKTAEDLVATIHNARQVSEKANKMLGKGGGFHAKMGAELAYSTKAHDWDVNADLRLYMSKKRDKFLLVGVNDIGEGNLFNAQIGKKHGALTMRGGVIDSRAGLGLDAAAGRRLLFSLDAYDLNDATLKARMQYRMLDDTYLFGQMNDVNHRRDRKTYVGIRREF